MTTVDILEAKTQLSKLVDAVESGAEDEIVIARNGRPAARLVPLSAKRRGPVIIGIAKGLFEAPEDINALDKEAAALFFGEEP